MAVSAVAALSLIHYILGARRWGGVLLASRYHLQTASSFIFQKLQPLESECHQIPESFPLLDAAGGCDSLIPHVPLHLAPTLPPTCPVLGISGDQWFSKEVLPIPGGILKMYEVFGLFSKVVVPQHLY